MASDPLQQHRDEMTRAFQRSGSRAVIEYIQGIDSGPLRRLLYITAKQVLAPQGDAGSLDDLATVADAAIAEMLRQADTSPDEETRSQCIRGAHIVSYNLAADLADCWPGDDLPRSKAHHERGFQAAGDCLTWSMPAGLPKPICNDLWVRGIHELALGDAAGAIRSWTKAREYALRAAGEDGGPATVDIEGSFLVLLTSGYLGLARWIGGDVKGRGQYHSAIAAFQAKLETQDAKEAKLALGQLKKTRSTYGPHNA